MFNAYKKVCRLFLYLKTAVWIATKKKFNAQSVNGNQMASHIGNAVVAFTGILLIRMVNAPLVERYGNLHNAQNAINGRLMPNGTWIYQLLRQKSGRSKRFITSVSTQFKLTTKNVKQLKDRV
jgi:hypothetical protein